MAEGLPWIIVAVLAIAVAVVGVLWRKRSVAGQAQRESDRSAAEERVRTVTQAHDEEIARLRRDHSAELERSRAEVERSRSDVERARKRLAETLGTEKFSRDMIVSVCDEVGLSGVLVTNVVFVTSDGADQPRFIAQVDHVLLAQQTIMLIENKYWQGMVFDGVRPSAVLPPLGTMLQEDTLEEPFAVQLAATSSSTWTVRRFQEKDSPATQVRRQAQRLSAALKSEFGSVPWLETAVVHSHSGATVFADPENRTANGAPTRIIAGRRRLAEVLTEIANRAPTTLTVSRLAELRDHFATLGAHIDEVGRAKREETPAATTRSFSA